MSIATDRFPMESKVAPVTPIFKKGQRTMLDNHRPISILPVVSKLMERILYDQIISRNRGHLNPETSLTSMSLITPFDPRNLLF
jgi:hypothetical protein